MICTPLLIICQLLIRQKDGKKNDQDGQYVTEPTSTVRTKKVQKALVLFPATDKHPAQTQLITEDITAGHWTTTKFATVMAAKEKREILARIVQLQDAVKIAREDANDVAVTEKQIASPLLKYIFGN
jgi:hypothetical protein